MSAKHTAPPGCTDAQLVAGISEMAKIRDMSGSLPDDATVCSSIWDAMSRYETEEGDAAVRSVMKVVEALHAALNHNQAVFAGESTEMRRAGFVLALAVALGELGEQALSEAVAQI